ncbi:hypothetical protein thsrh120_63760 [Rhizobium sp. No.120]
MESRFGKRIMATAMVIGLALSILYGLSGTHKRSEPAAPAASDVAK